MNQEFTYSKYITLTRGFDVVCNFCLKSEHGKNMLLNT